MTFILDASVSLAFVLPDEGTAVARRLLSAVAREEAIVPSLWHCRTNCQGQRLVMSADAAGIQH